jgi:predicted permease
MGLLTAQLDQILRSLRRSPMFTAVTLLILALGIGGTTTIYSIVNGVLFQPLPYPQPSRLVEVSFRRPGKSPVALSWADYIVFRERSRAFQDIGVCATGINSSGYEVNVTGLGKPERLVALPVTDGLLPILGVTPLLGRSFTRADDRVGSPNTVILTYGYWRSRFGGDRSVIGKTIDVDGKPRAIIGVLPQHFRFLDMTSLAMLMPIKLEGMKITVGGYYFPAIARLKPGVTLAEANADVARMIPIVFRSFPAYPGYSIKFFEDWRLGPNVRPLKQEVVGDVGKVLWVLMGGMSLVLVIACANLANLLLVRAEGRQQELAIRAALGATRRRIATGLLSESLILALIGGLLGLGLAYGALRALIAIAPPGLPRLNEIVIDRRVVLFALVVAVVTSLLFGSVPVFKYAGASLGIRLREGGRSMSHSRERHRSRAMLVIVQVALALVLLVGSGLMIRTFRALTRVNPGFVAPSELQTFCVFIPDAQVKDERVTRVEKEIGDKIQDLPGVSSVGISRSLPMDGSGWNDSVVIRGHAYAPGEALLYRYDFVAPGFLKTLGTPLVAGRDFTWSDTFNKRPVAMVSENFARQYWRDPASALGKQIRQSAKDEWRQIVGVVADVHQDGVGKEAPQSVYWPILMDQIYGHPGLGVRRNVAFAIRSPRAGSEGLISEVRRAVWSVDPNLPLFEVHTLDYYYTKSMARTSFTLVMLAIAGGMALLLGIVGLYGVIAYSVSQRTHEIGIRMALGAGKSDIVRMVIATAIRLALVGVAIGLAGALGFARFLSSLLYGVKATDPPTLVAVALLLIAVAFLASYVPAQRAAKLDPMMALRYE